MVTNGLGHQKSPLGRMAEVHPGALLFLVAEPSETIEEAHLTSMTCAFYVNLMARGVTLAARENSKLPECRN
jgi:hypothetical protein